MAAIISDGKFVQTGKPERITRAKIFLKTADAFFIKPLHEVKTLNRGMREERWVQRAEKEYARAVEDPKNKYWIYENAADGWKKAARLAGLEGRIKEKEEYQGKRSVAMEKCTRGFLYARGLGPIYDNCVEGGSTDNRDKLGNEKGKLASAIAGIDRILGNGLSPESIIKLCNDALNANPSPKMKIILHLSLAQAHAELGNAVEKERALFQVRQMQYKITRDMGGKLENK